MTPPTRVQFSGKAARLPAWEQEIIGDTAGIYGVDPLFLAAIRIAENGGPGRQFGVLSVSAPTYNDQARLAAQSIRASMARYASQTGDDPIVAGHPSRAFVEFFARRWAPLGAANDPMGLNNNFVANVMAVLENSAVMVA